MTAGRLLGKSPLPWIYRRARCRVIVSWIAFFWIALWGHAQPLWSQVAAEYHRTLTVRTSETVTLDIDVSKGDLEIRYGREGQVSIAAFTTATAADRVGDLFPEAVSIEQDGNHVTIRHVLSPAFRDGRVSVVYRIDVPYRTELSSRLEAGKQNIQGLLGPVKVLTNKGDVTIAYISQSVQAQVGIGNLDIQVVGDHVEAEAAVGNISCTRLPRGVRAQTGEGDITLMIVGPSTATIERGNGRIEVGGAKGSLVGSTNGGDLHVKAAPHEDWKLSSVSGRVLLELPPAASFELEASTKSGELQFNRDELARSDSSVLQFHQSFNGGGKRISVHTESGTIALR